VIGCTAKEREQNLPGARLVERISRPPCSQQFVPYIYSRSELRLLLRATRSSQKQPARKIESRTLRTLLVFLYGTGAQTGEALNLQNMSVNLKKDVLTIRGGRFNRVRCIPISPDLHRVMRRYAQFTARKKIEAANFFVTRDGEALNVVTLAKTFQWLRRAARIAGPDGCCCYRPRMHDLRHTFAVHRPNNCSALIAEVLLHRIPPAQRGGNLVFPVRSG
jgi:integrase/recombinase XerD